MPALETKRPEGVAGTPTGYVNEIGRGKRRFFTDDDDAFQSSPTIETISEDLNEMKIRIKSCPKKVLFQKIICTQGTCTTDRIAPEKLLISTS